MIEFYVQYWSGCNKKCNFCSQQQGNQQELFGKFKNPSKKSMLLNNKILLDKVREYIENENFGNSLICTFVGRWIVLQNR